MSSPKLKKRRPYRLQRRAVRQAETHHALARAAFELHSSIGPARTTVSAIAEKAGVQRLTVYRHFPDHDAIFTACSAYSFAHDPPPNPEAWRAIADAELRLQTALRELYGYYGRKRQLLANLYRDAEMPVVGAALSRRREVLAKGVDILLQGWVGADGETGRLIGAAIGHALDFTTWCSLVETQGLSEEEAAEAMRRLIRGMGERIEVAPLPARSVAHGLRPQRLRRGAARA
jgi:AcrR family transcriptional regulator